MSKSACKPFSAATRPRGPYREPTTPVRIPRSMLPLVKAMLAAHGARIADPLLLRSEESAQSDYRAF